MESSVGSDDSVRKVADLKWFFHGSFGRCQEVPPKMQVLRPPKMQVLRMMIRISDSK